MSLAKQSLDDSQYFAFLINSPQMFPRYTWSRVSCKAAVRNIPWGWFSRLLSTIPFSKIFLWQASSSLKELQLFTFWISASHSLIFWYLLWPNNLFNRFEKDLIKQFLSVQLRIAGKINEEAANILSTDFVGGDITFFIVDTSVNRHHVIFNGNVFRFNQPPVQQ